MRCSECVSLINAEFASLEANVDPVDRGALAYQEAERQAIRRCSVHGDHAIPVAVPEPEGET